MRDQSDTSPFPQQPVAVDVDEVATAMVTSDPELSCYLHRETGVMALVSAETRADLEEIYTELGGDADLPEASVAAAIRQRATPDWQREALLEADQVERGLARAMWSCLGSSPRRPIAPWRSSSGRWTTRVCGSGWQRLLRDVEPLGAFGGSSPHTRRSGRAGARSTTRACGSRSRRGLPRKGSWRGPDPLRRGGRRVGRVRACGTAPRARWHRSASSATMRDMCSHRVTLLLLNIGS